MSEISYYGLGLIFALIGLFFFLATRFLARSLPTLGTSTRVNLSASPAPENVSSDAVLIVQSGGRIISLNARARQAFHLQEGEIPDLERLLKRLRPADAFINLCAAEGQARFVLDGRLAEGVSYSVHSAGEQVMLVSLRFPELATGLTDSGSSANSQNLLTFTELTQAMAASLELDLTLQAVLENIEKMIPADFMEITLWDAETSELVPYRFTGLPGVERKLERVNLHYTASDGYTGYLYSERTPLLISDVEARRDLRPSDNRPAGLRSYLGIPLVVGTEFVGTLELGSLSLDSFHEEDLGLVKLLSGQAATALHNAVLYREEKKRSSELAGLAQVAQAFSSVRDPKSLFTRLVASISPLFNVQILGFLLYNESQHMLEGQIPFAGLPDQIVELYRAPVATGSAAEQTIQDQDVLITENAAQDQQWQTLGLDYLAQAASLHDTVLIPLASGGRMLGYLQASNHLDGSTFTQAELHLLMIIANQSASIIENATLVQQSRQRAQRAEALRQIASLSGSVATLDEILKYSLLELTHMLRADVGAVFLIDPTRTMLRLHQPSMVGSLSELTERGMLLTVDDPQFPFTVADTQHSLRFGLVAEEKAVIPFYQNLVTGWMVQSVLAVPLVARNEGIGELWFGAKKADFFDKSDLQLVATAAGQLADVVEQASLRNMTDEGLRLQVGQLMAVTRISRELSNTLDLPSLLKLVLDEASHISGADCGTILFFDSTRSLDEPVVVREFSGEKHSSYLNDLERQALEQAMVLRFDHLQASSAPHPGIQSSLIIPIIYQQRPAGMISLHGQRENQFDDSVVEICQSLSVQAAIALGNATQFDEQSHRGALLRRELDTLTELLRVSQMMRPSLPLEQSLAAIGSAICQATPFQVNVISVYDPATKMLNRVYSSGLPEEQWVDLQAHSQSWTSMQVLMQPEYRVGNIYFIPADKSPLVPEDVYSIAITEKREHPGKDAWDPDDFLLVPLVESNGDPLGLISVDAPADGRRPDRPTLEALELFAIQAALMVENHRRTALLESQVGSLELERARLEQAGDAARQNLPVILRKDLEQTVALQSLGRRIDRIRSTLEIASLASNQPESGLILRTLASELLTRFALQTALIAEKTPTGMRLLEVLGNVPSAANPESLFGQRNPLRQMLQESGSSESATLLVANLENDTEWQNSPLLTSLEARSLVGLLMGTRKGEALAVLAVGRRALPSFSDEDRRIFDQLAQQVSVGLQNLHLLKETQRRLTEVNLLLEFSLKLGSLKPENILSVLVESVLGVLSGENAGWVALWDNKQTSLVPQAASGYADNDAILKIKYGLVTPTGEVMDARKVLPMRVFREGEPLRADEIDFSTQYHLSADDLLNYRQATRGRLPASAMVLPLRLGESVSGVMMLENFEAASAFSSEDEALAYSFTQQAALALDNARLYQASEQRADQLHNLTRVSSLLTSSLKSEELINTLLDLLKIVIPYNNAILWLRQGNSLSVAAASGFEDNIGQIGISAAVEDSVLFRDMVRSGQPIAVGDVRNDPRFPQLVEAQNLSWLGLPLISKSEVVGLIAMEKLEMDFYTPENIRAATTFAGQATIALENAHLFEESARRTTELDERTQRLTLLNRLSEELSASLDSTYILKLTGERLMDALDASIVGCVMVGPGGSSANILEMETPPQNALLPVAFMDVPVFTRLSQSQGIFSTADVRSERELAPIFESYFAPRKIESLLMVPLITGGVLLGWFMIQTSQTRRFSLSEIELARTVSNQAAIAIQNARLFDETRSLTEFLERRVEERTGELRHEHQNSQTLLRVITELTSSLDMGLVLNRALNVLNESLGSQESMIYLLQSSQKPYRAGEPLVAESNVGEGTHLEREIGRWVAHTKKPVLVENMAFEGRWPCPPDALPVFRSVMGVPLVMGEDVLGALLLFHREEKAFKPQQLDLVEATSRQIGIALSNAELFNLIRDQSEHLGNMLRDQQIEASRSRAILEAVADGVVVTDDHGRINLFNASAESILELKSSDVIGQPLDMFTGLFGKSGIAWMRTINRWSQEPKTYRGEAFADQFELDNGCFIAVHLAPVFWRAQFLGTVSIFRDITHQVQVDRLKTEFVANVSHELRTPMTSIKGYVEIMLMGATGELSGQQRHFLEIVKSNTERLNILVNDLLDISRIESGRVTLNMQAVNLVDVIQQVTEDVEKRSKDENHPMNFKVEVAEGVTDISGDVERVHQVVAALITNGYLYTPDNGHVTVSVHPEGEYVQVDVQDDGIGISIEDHARIFERFYRGEDPLVLASAGTGLGLAISKTIVTNHGGRIWFKSNGIRGLGSVFSFTLPIYQNEE